MPHAPAPSVQTPGFSVEAAQEGEGFRIRRPLGRAGADLCHSNGFAAGLFRLLPPALHRLRHAHARDLRRRARAARTDDPLAAAAHREHPSANSRRLRRSGGPEDRRRLLARRDVQRRAGRLPAPPLERSRTLGAEGLRLSRKARSPAGPPKAATSPISGRRKWRRSATNIGSASPPGRRAMRSRSASPEAPAPPVRGSTTAQPLITGKPLDTTGLGYDPSKPQMSGGVIDSHIFVDESGDAVSVLEGRHEQHLATPARDALCAAIRS